MSNKIETIIIIDYGSQYTQLIARRIRELEIFCLVYPFNKITDTILKEIKPSGFILSGGPKSVLEKNSPKLNKSIFHHIGVYGFQKQFLKEYVSQTPSKRELEEKLEQLRVSENTKISITVIDEEILGVDTKEDLDTVNQLIQDHG